MKNSTEEVREFTAFFPFCGLGAGARGFLQAAARLGEHGARFRNLGGIDNDPLACADFEYLTGSKALCADINAVSPEQLRAYAGERRPDVVFGSPPCKSFSRLLSKDLAATEKYQRMNRLVLQSLFLVCETWKDDPPSAILIENVPGIMTRGAHILAQVKQLLMRYGYVFHEGTHNCGELGGLAQNRIRYLLVARRPKAVPAFIYRPPRLRVKGCGEVLETLPLPEDEEAGPLHALPRLSWLNWVRLALIPAGGDWRDLPASVPEAMLQDTGTNAERFKGRPGHMAVLGWGQPSRAVNGTATVSGSTGSAAVADPRVPRELVNPVKPGAARRSVFPKYDVRRWEEPARTVAGSGTNGGFAVADPRIGLEHEPRRGRFGVTAWDEPSPTVRGVTTVRNAPAAVADLRVQAALALPENPGRHEAKYRVTAWTEPTGAITAARPVTSGGPSVADPRIDFPDWNPNAHRNKYAVTAWQDPAGCVTASERPGGGGQSVADPRLPLEHADRTRGGVLGVLAWDKPAPTITGNMEPARSNTPANVADPRTVDPRLRCKPRAGMYGVLSWQQAAATIIGNARIDAGTFAVADPRKAPPRDELPVIVAQDGTWHRPLTKLELAALQGLPARVDGKPLRLATMKDIGRAGRAAPSSPTERIGNAVPVGAARAMGESILTALLAAKLGTWMLSNEGIWVRKDGVDEAQANAPWLPEDLEREEARFESERW